MKNKSDMKTRITLEQAKKVKGRSDFPKLQVEQQKEKAKLPKR